MDEEDLLEPGKSLGDFLIEKRIGRGGMGVVYVGRQVSLERPVAIKVLGWKAASNETFIRRFSGEARAAAQIIHNNIVQIYSVGREDDVFYIAMEFVDGKSVREMINKTKAIPENLAIDIILQASLGLQKAHEKNIVHRDIKPDNLLINNYGEVKVTDFGLAIDLGEVRQDAGPRKPAGSPHYMSPEQALRGEASFSSDIYSLGATLYHMTTSIPPFTGNSPASILAKHVTDYPISPREINSNLSKGLCQLIQKMMEKKPEERFPNMAAVVEHLRLLREDQSRSPDSEEMHWFVEEKDASKRLRDTVAIVEVNKVLAQERDLDTLLLRVVHEITKAMNAERSTLYIYDPDNQEIWTKVAEGIESGMVLRLPLGKGIAGIVARDLKPELINDSYSDSRFNVEVDTMTGFKTRNMLCMPILGRQLELLGVLQVLNKIEGNFDHYDESLLSMLAVHVGLALEKSRYFCALRPGCKEARSY
jgi:predicted Ser/Thr protein kinase